MSTIPQTKVAQDSAVATSNAMPKETSAASKSKQVFEADLNVVACNVDASVSIDVVEVKPSDGNENRNETEYNVGDLVWAKIKSHPWWPGQIHDPQNASGPARPVQEGKLLVAFYGDGSFSWCSPSQIVPFIENFSRLSKDGSSRSFSNAVSRTLDEVSRILDSHMTCSCASPGERDALIRPEVENAGIKVGVLVPEVDFAGLSLPNYEAPDVLSKLAGFAKNVPSNGVLDIGVVRGWISAFRRSKGLGKLQEYHEPAYIEGLEDNSSDEGISDDVSVPIRAPSGPQEEDDEDEDDGGPSSPNSGALVGKPRRRRKSVSVIMAESAGVPPKRRKRTPVRYVEKPQPISDVVKKSDVVGKDGANSSGKKNDKGKAKESESPKTADESANIRDNTAENGAGGSLGEKKNSEGKAKGSESPGTADEVGSKRKPEAIEGVDLEEGDVVVLSPRERKKSKYLSSPYIEPIGRVGSSSFKKVLDASSKEAKIEGEGEPNVIMGPKKPVEDVSADEVKEGSSNMDADLDIPLSSLKSKVDSPAKKGSKGKADSSEKSKSKKSAEGSQAGEKASTSLVLAFAPGFPLPSKEEILKVYSKFGRLNEQETVVVVDSHSAKVVFEKDDDVETAFKSSVSENLFGAESVETHWLRYGSGARGPHVPEGSDKAVVGDDAVSEMNVIRNKLEITDAILRAYHGKFKEDDKEGLKVDLRNLSERVEAVRERVNEMAHGTKLSKKRGD